MGSIVRYHGGKVRLAPKIITHFPSHEAYVEPYGGGAAVLLAKDRARLEVYNDMNGEMTTLFRVLRDRPAELIDAVALTPFSRDEFECAFCPTEDEIEVARHVLVRSHFAHGSMGIQARSARDTGFRAAGMRAGTLPAHLWSKLPDVIAKTADRMRAVVIENRPALDVMKASDGSTTLHYVDPPYVTDTRSKGKVYRFEMTDDQHLELLECLVGLEGKVIVSGYASDMYDDALGGWRRSEMTTRGDCASEKTEVMWMNFEDQAPLFVAGTH
ncbi:MAG: DNA adenine methylase [Pseudomonadota bacterium]